MIKKLKFLIFLFSILLNLALIFNFFSKYNFSINQNQLSVTKKENLNFDSYLNTSLYNFKIDFIEIGKSEKYGAIEIINDDLFYISQDGNIYLLYNEKLKSLNVDKIENNKEEFIKNFSNSEAYLDGFTVRDSFYDNDISTLFTSSIYYDYENDCYNIGVFKIKLLFKNLNYKFDRKGWENIFHTSPCISKQENDNFFQSQSAGGRIQKISEDSYLLTVGDFNFFESEFQNLNLYKQESDYSKIIKFDLDGNKEVYSSGHRNPQGLAVINQNYEKLIIESEHGPEGGDEINIIEKNKHYGFPYLSYGTNYGSQNWSGDELIIDEKFSPIDPLFSFTPAIGISELTEFKNLISLPKWDGDILITSLRGKSIFRAKLNHKNNINFIEKIFINKRIRDISYNTKGEIFLLEDSLNQSVNNPVIIKLTKIL